MQEVEDMMRDYHNLKKQLNILAYEIEHFKGIDEAGLIESMCFSHPEGERVKTSMLSDKTAKVAIALDSNKAKVDEDRYQFYFKEWKQLKDRIEFFELSLFQLSGELPEMMQDLIIKKYSWDEIADKYHMSRTMVGRYRKKAIKELKSMYELRNQKNIEFMLS
ncbi:MAG: hypothetical protein EOM00_12545 [Clostridia bacterium]|nr:hypothetical protein [Clostridia bacterium]